jgi:predicted nucleic acid-binding protein
VARNVVVDAGPIVAALVSDDAFHPWAKQQFATLRPPLLTCEPVLTEVAFVLGRIGGEPQAALELVEKGVLRVALSVQDQAGPLRALMRRYRNLPMSLADACLVRLTELVDDAAILTLDADFRVYRRHRRLVIPLLAPEGV